MGGSWGDEATELAVWETATRRSAVQLALESEDFQT